MVRNELHGEVTGFLVQARDIHGGVHHNSHVPRPPVELPYRFGDVPLRSGGFQDREAVQVLASHLDDGRGEVAATDRRVHTVVLTGWVG